MSFQDIRRYLETPVIDVCASFNIPYRPANTLEPNGDAYSEFVESRLQFGEMSAPVVSDCPLVTNIRGTFIVEYYGPKGRGPARAQNYMEALYCQISLPGVTNINGPVFTELSDRPYYFARLSMGIINNSYITTP